MCMTALFLCKTTLLHILQPRILTVASTQLQDSQQPQRVSVFDSPLLTTVHGTSFQALSYSKIIQALTGTNGIAYVMQILLVVLNSAQSTSGISLSSSSNTATRSFSYTLQLFVNDPRVTVRSRCFTSINILQKVSK